MTKIVAVEVQGWDRNYWNMFPDSRDLSAPFWSGTATVAYTETGMSGLPNTASLVTDSDGVNYRAVDSRYVQVNDEGFVALRAFVKKDATSSPGVGIRLRHSSGVAVGYRLNTSTGAFTGYAGTASGPGSQATLRTFAGVEWWEVWIWCYNEWTALYCRIYPAVDAAADQRSVTIGNIELYQQGNGPSGGSPVDGVWNYLDGTPPNYGDFYFASQSFVTEPAGTLNFDLFGAPYLPERTGPVNTAFKPRLVGDLRYTVRVNAWPWRGSTSIGIGSVEVANDDGALDTWREMEWRDRFVTLKLHDTDYEYLPYVNPSIEGGADTLLVAIVERMEVVSESVMRLVLRDPVPDLYKPFTSTYAVNSPDTTPDAQYRTVPIAFGNPLQCQPVLIDSSTFAYDLSDTALTAVSEVYINGVAQSTASPTYSASGTGFTLPAEASGRVTADPQSIATPDFDDLISSITDRVTTVTFDTVTQTAINALAYSGTTYRYGYYVDEPTNPAKILDWACSSWGGWWWVNRLGNVQFGRLLSPDTLLENKLNTSLSDARDLSTWESTSNATASYNAVGLDGKISASTLGDSSAAQVGIVRTDHDLLFTADTNPVCLRAWVKKDSTSSPDPVFRVRSTVTGDLIRCSLDTSAGTTSNLSSGANTSIQTTQVTLGGNDWWELVVQADNDSNSDYRVDIYPAGEVAANVRTNLVVGGVEVYENATISDVAGTPPNLTTSRIIDESNMLGEIGIKPDHAPGLSDGAGADRNWSRGRTSEGSGINAEKFSREYQSERRTSTSMHSAYEHAVGARLPMSLIAGTNAAAIAGQESDRMAALYQQERYFYTVKIGFEVGRFDDYVDQIGQVFQLQLDRYGLGSKNLLLVGVSGAFLGYETTLTLWG